MTASRPFRFRLYVAGNGPNSVLAIANLRALCQQHLPDRHQIEIVDLTKEPAKALDDRVMLTPMLVKLSPAPVRRIIGNLSHEAALLAACDLPSRP